MRENSDALLWDSSLLDFRNRVATGKPTPGGGAVAAVAATFAAALLQMVCAISTKRNSDARITAIGMQVKNCEEELARCAEEDIRAFDRYMAARKLRSASAHSHIQDCLLECTEVPLAAAEAVVRLETCAAEMVPKTPEFLSSDLSTARHLLEASRKALLANVIVNLADMEDGEAKRVVLRRLHGFQLDENAAG